MKVSIEKPPFLYLLSLMMGSSFLLTLRSGEEIGISPFDANLDNLSPSLECYLHNSIAY